MSANPGRDVPIPRCHRRCGELMNAFDQLSPRLRRFFNDEVCIRWCMCQALRTYQQEGETKALAIYRALERKYR